MHCLWLNNIVSWLCATAPALLVSTGSGICRKVIKEIGPHISGCQCQLVNKLAVYLEKRDVLNEEDYRQLKREDATGNKLNDVLFTASIEKRGRGRHLIKNLYLSLLDAFLDRGDQWFHYTALYIVRETGRLLATPNNNIMLFRADGASLVILYTYFAFVSAHSWCSQIDSLLCNKHNYDLDY